ncbi:TBC1 domain family member 2B-like isoform X2 [Mercenaria mercenaria]|uniref:TBC1 domain family member 2B-like isoform X2 n=1 Tax=Mercenaria mercenaria TaxID=6596 RepID=UPI00234FA926|nr:TBC1 domain family member 2B-like isoform X2 [Mercenaria mercenaria]
MMYWLQALQNKRREFNLSRVNVSHDRVGQWSNKRVSNAGGLLSRTAGSSDVGSQPTVFSASDLPEIRVPDSDTYSSNSSLNSLPPLPPSSSRPLWALNNLKAELQQKWSGIRLPARAVRKKKTKSAECPGKLSKDSQQQEFSDSIFYCDLKVRSDSELTSTASVNSAEGSEQTKCLLLDIEPDDAVKSRTGSQVSTESEEKDIEQTLCAKTNRNVSRNTGSWAVIDKSDIIAEEDVKAGNKTDNSDDPNETWKPYTSNSKNQSQVDLEPGKSGKFITTLKKMRFGRRQISEPGPIPRPKPQTVNSNIPKHQSHTGETLRDRSSSKDINDLEEELQANREIISLLQRNLDEVTKEMQSRQEAEGATEEEKTSMLVERDKELVRLQHQLDKAKQEYSLTAEKLRSTDTELKSSHEQVMMFTDMLKAKDEILVSLSNQLQSAEEEKQEHIQRTSSFDQPDVIQSLSARESTTSLSSERADLRELERYKDICQGYELQHKFLTKEILELNDLRKDDLAREKKLMMDFAKMQAKYYQIKSKYYVLLKQQKEQGPVRDGEEGQEVVNQLLTDALGTDDDDIEMHLTGSIEEYDKYGFSRKHYTEETEEVEEYDPLGSKAAVLEKQSEELNTKVKEADQAASLRVKWENYLVGRGGKLQKSTELKMLIRQGVPHEFREEVWKGCVNFHISDIREKMGPTYYQDLLQRKAFAQGSDPSIKQIELDLLRTLPNNKHYESIESEGIIKLRKVLLAFSEYNRIIGYCQGLNRLAAIALLFLNEEDAFWCLVAIVDHILPPEYFSTTLMAAQADQRVLKDL